MLDIVNAVAELLKLKDGTVNNDGTPIPMPGWWSLPGVAVIRKHAEPPDILVLAAYAKAEMAKRGFTWDIGKWGDGVAIGLRMSEVKDYRCPYDTSDPISEASAVLMCIYQCMQSNADSKGRGHVS